MNDSLTHNQHNGITNSHILVEDFDYFEASSIDEAVNMLDQYGPGAKVVAGGSHLYVAMKMEHDHPGLVVNINKIPGLNAIERNENGDLVIGACTTIRKIRHDPMVVACYQALSDACASFGSAQVEIMGTIGGNVCNGSPAADTIPALVVMDARVVIQGKNGKREMPVEKFVLSPGKVDLQQSELLTHIIIPATQSETVGMFIKVTRVFADLAKASLAVQMVRDGDRVVECKIACGAVAPIPLRIRRAEELLTGKYMNAGLIEEAAKIVSEDIRPIDDIRSSAWYRREILRVATIDALNTLWLRAEQGKCEKPEIPVYNDLGSDRPVLINSGLQKKEELREIEFSLNGSKKRVAVKPNELLLNVIRDKLQYTGTKYGCGVGECGACTVLMNDKPVFSCLVLATAVAGQEITTIEGLQGPAGELDPLQKAFVDQAAYQCGYCTPGFVMTLKGFLKENPVPSEQEIRDNIKGNRCRCTGYFSILRAVRSVVSEQKLPDLEKEK